MTKNSTAPVAAPPAIVAEAWQQVGASFDRFCLASGVAALQTMMEQDATPPSVVRATSTRTAATATAGAVPRGRSVFTAARSRSIVHGCGRTAVRRWRCQAGRRHRRRIGWAAGR